MGVSRAWHSLAQGYPELMTAGHNKRAALDAGGPSCFPFARHWPGTSEHGRSASVSMRLSITKLLLPILVSTFLCGRSHAANLVGVWRTEAAQLDNPTGHTNEIDGFYRVEFLKDGTFKFGQFIKGVGGQELPMPLAFGGKYRVVDSSHIRLEVSKSPATPSGGKLMTVSYSVSGDTLELQDLSEITKTAKYRRVKQ